MTHLLDPDAMTPMHERIEDPHGPALDNAFAILPMNMAR